MDFLSILSKKLRSKKRVEKSEDEAWMDDEVQFRKRDRRVSFDLNDKFERLRTMTAIEKEGDVVDGVKYQHDLRKGNFLWFP